MKKSHIVVIVVLASFFFFNYAATPLMSALPFDYQSWPKGLYSSAFMIVFEILLPLVLIALLHGFSRTFSEAGWKANLWQGFGVAFLCTLPMLIGYAFTAQPPQFGVRALVNGALLPGIGEETVFRAFLFGQLFRHGRWGFLTAVLFQSVLFGAGHLWQGNSLAETTGVFAITFMGGVWFAWLMVEWRWNIWIPAFLHVLMNAYWSIFGVADSAAGGLWANVFRFSTVAVSIFVTIRYAKSQGAFLVNKHNLWTNTP